MSKLKSLLWAALFVVVSMSVAYAVPAHLRLPANSLPPKAQALHAPSADDKADEGEDETDEPEDADVEDENEDAESPDENESEEPEDDAESEGDAHGDAVSAAAHCDLDGRAHGEFVSSVAHDETATPESVATACADAMAAQAAAPETHGSSGSHEPNPHKPTSHPSHEPNEHSSTEHGQSAAHAHGGGKPN